MIENLKTAQVLSQGIDLDYLIVTALAYTGMRVGEVLALNFSDIDYKNRVIKIKKTLVTGDNRTDYRITTPKTKSSVRNKTINQKLVDFFKVREKEVLKYKK